MSVHPAYCACPCHKPGHSVATSGHQVEELPGCYICIPCPDCWTPDTPAEEKPMEKEGLKW